MRILLHDNMKINNFMQIIGEAKVCMSILWYILGYELICMYLENFLLTQSVYYLCIDLSGRNIL